MHADQTRLLATTGARFAIALLATAALAAWFSYPDEFVAALPYLFLLACPLMHLLHSHRRHHHGAQGRSSPPIENRDGG